VSVTHGRPGGRRAVVELVPRDQAPLLARRFYGEHGPVSPITASLAHVPELLDVALPFIDAALGPGTLGERLKEIAVLRTSALLGCRYCVQTHTAVALDSGLTAAEVRALRGEAELAPAFGAARDRAAIAWIDAVASGRGPVDGVLRELASTHFDDPELVELTMAVTSTAMLNRYCSSLALPTSARTLARLARAGFK